MKKIWFRTSNDGIVDLNRFDSFWFQPTPYLGKNSVSVFGSQIPINSESTTALGHFECEEVAKYYLTKIYSYIQENNEISESI